MKKILAISLIVCAIFSSQAALSIAKHKDKDPKAKPSRLRRPLARNQLVTLTNGTGDGTVSIPVDGYGSFGSATPSGDAIYNPIGPIGPSGTVFESAVYFSPINNFLSTESLPPISIRSPDPKTAISQFTIAGFNVKLTQKLLAPSSKGSTFTQTYVITNNTGGDKTIRLVRHVDGDLDFDNSISDAGGVSADDKTLYEFDSGDNPDKPITFVGIQSFGGTRIGFTVQPYPFSGTIIADGGIRTGLIDKISGDTDGNGVTDSPYDITLSQQNNFTVLSGQSVTYKTSTIFGEGTIDEVTSATSGCTKFNNLPLKNRTVTLKQPGEADKTTTTDADGCYAFDRLVPGKTFSVNISGPLVPTSSRSKSK